MKIFILFEMIVLITTLKILFSGGSAIFFYIDVVYWVSGTLAFLIIISNSSIKKLISNKTAMLIAYSGYFLGCLRLCLTRAGKSKVTKADLATYFMKDIFARDVSV